MLVRAKAKVLDSLTSVLRATENESVATRGRTESKLVEGNGLTTGGDDAGTGRGGESQSSNGELGEGQEAVIIRHSANDDDGPLLLLRDVGDDARQRNRGAVDLGHEKASEDNLVKGSIGTAWQIVLRQFRLNTSGSGGVAWNVRDRKR